jgi:hypothetical protein
MENKEKKPNPIIGNIITFLMGIVYIIVLAFAFVCLFLK